MGQGGVFWQNTLQINKCQFVKPHALTTVKSGGVLVIKSLSNHSFAAYARWENSQLGNWIALRSSSMGSLPWQCYRKVSMTNHGNSGQRNREGKIKVLVNSCQAATLLCSSPQECLDCIQRNNDDLKEQEDGEMSSQVLFQAWSWRAATELKALVPLFLN